MDWLKLNFYDIFGYLIPGSVAIALIWVPVYLSDPKHFELSVAGAFLGVALCFAMGLTVAETARSRISSRTWDERLPTDWLLDNLGERIGGVKAWKPGDPDQGSSTPNQRKRPEWARPWDEATATSYVDAAKALLGVTASVDLPLSRNATAMQARRLLITKGRSQYLEKFQGLQALARGLYGACELGGLFLLGLGIAAIDGSTCRVLHQDILLWSLLAALVSVVWTAVEYQSLPRDWTTGAAFVLRAAALVGGLLFAAGPYAAAWMPAGLAGLAIFLTRGLFREAHNRFAKSFAEETMRALIDLHMNPESAQADGEK